MSIDNDNKSLKKNLKFFPVLTTVMGTVIGAGVFFKAPSVFGATHSAGLGMLSWLLAGIITICAGLTVAEIAAAFPETGGMVMYIKHAYGRVGKPLAFILGWAQTLVYIPASIASLGIIFGTQMVNLFSWDNQWIIYISIITITSLTLVNMFGSKVGGSIQSATFIFKMIPLAIIVIQGFLQPDPVGVVLVPFEFYESTNIVTALGNGLLATMFAYDGWINVGTLAGEMKNPKKDLPRAIILGITLITAVYLFVNMAYLLTLPIENIAGNENAAMDVASRLFGSKGGRIVTTGILISVYGTINGYTITGIRVPYGLAVDDNFIFKKWFLKLNRWQVPYAGGLVILIVAILMSFSGQFDALTDMLLFVIWSFYVLTFFAIFILRKKYPDLSRPYKVPLYPWVPFVAILGGLFIVVNTLFTKFDLAMIGFAITAVSIPVYYFGLSEKATLRREEAKNKIDGE